MSQRPDAIVEWLRQRLNQAGARGFVVGLSGGVDSAVVARLCQAAAPARVVGVLMPCHGDPQDEADALLVAEHFGIPWIRIDLGPVFDPMSTALRQALTAVPPEQLPDPAHVEDLKGARPFTKLKPRLRMATLYGVANALTYIVAGSANRSELAVGYFTKHGDNGVDLLPIGDLLKSEVRAAAKELGVPESIIHDKMSTTGLWAGQTEEAEMGFTYAELEKYLNAGAETVSPALAMRIERLMRTSEHKRALPPTPGAKT
jgi:NAD+ synthase